ncbi:MAG: AAA family ATPase, partial [Gammaproteobacteria bacterium]|nr:AAA family ATPase [Gammaproteobacteria bacterium]
MLVALEQDPSNIEIRLHVAGLYLAEQAAEPALTHYKRVLEVQPSHTGALAGAATAAEALGQATLADGYSRLLAALSGRSDDHGAAPKSNVELAKPSTSADRAGQTGRDESVVPRLAVASSAADNVTVGPWDDPAPRVTLADVGGMQEVKNRLETAFLGPMRNPDLLRMYGKSLRGGLMLYGPPGCGKTFIARALAGELGANFYAIGLSDVLDMWLGESERKLHEIFETARRN